MTDFWQNLPRPFSILAPMDGVTDVVFRQIITEIGRPDVFFTEFVNTDGLTSVGKERVLEKLKFKDNEQPVVAQIWGTNPDHFYESAKIAVDLGFSGIDINMGCPDKTILKGGSCAALIKNPELAEEIIKATKKGTRSANSRIPVSVKTRIGFSDVQIDEWLGFLLRQDIAALTVHLRTVKEMSLVPAHWDLMPRIMDLRNTIAPHTLLIGNGDILSLKEVEDKNQIYGCDGYMIGRGIFHNPWLFNEKIDVAKVSVNERIALYLKHITEFEKTWDSKNFALLKKFCKTYIQNFDGASDLRVKLMEAKTIGELKNVLRDFKSE